VAEQMQIGEVAETTGLSLRTIRHYEDVGLIGPAARTKGGFRLYTQADVVRLRLIRTMKPLDFTLEEMRDLLEVLDALDQDDEGPVSREVLVDRLAMYRMAAIGRVRALREQLAVAEAFADRLRDEVARHSVDERRRGAGRRLTQVADDSR
jgi:DNA-binding transcriptional MerR regulator